MVGKGGCIGGTIEVVWGGGVYILDCLVNELGLNGLLLPFLPTLRLWNKAMVGQLRCLREVK